MNFKSIKNNKSEDYEEISEKRTSILGYILLFIMVIFVIGIGQTIFQDLNRFVDRPISPDSCIYRTINNGNLKTLSYSPYCNFRDKTDTYKLKQQYNNLNTSINEIINLNTSISDFNSKNYKARREAEKLNKNYDLSLQEKIAGEENTITNKDNIKQGILNTQASVQFNQNNISNLEKRRNDIIKRIAPQISTLKSSYEKANEAYKTQYAIYRLKTFLLNLLFVLPLFLFSAYLYFKLKRKNSPYTIIMTAVLTASSILFLQVVSIFLYEILPKTWLARIFSFFMDTPFLRYILYYGSVILVIVIFGGIVYLIQKNVFDPKKVAIRRLKDNKCPGCAFTLDHNHTFCPKCGQKLKDTCTHCGKQKVHYLTHCPSCGKK